MALSRLAREYAAEIRAHDWSDAPYRADRAGHRREDDRGWRDRPRLSERETEIVRLNVMWVVGQVLGHAGVLRLDEIYEWAEACGCDTNTPAGRPRSRQIRYGFRFDGDAFAGPAAVPLEMPPPCGRPGCVVPFLHMHGTGPVVEPSAIATQADPA